MSVSSDTNAFNELSSKITQLQYGRREYDRVLIKKTLTQLNGLNYRYTIVTNPTKALLLINQCPSLIPAEDKELVVQCSQLFTSLMTRQNIAVEGRTLIIVSEWLVESLQGNLTDVDLLIALDSILRPNGNHNLLTKLLQNRVFMVLTKADKEPNLALFALQCLEACTIPREDEISGNSRTDYMQCFHIFLHHLVMHTFDSETLYGAKTYMVCLRGLQNIIWKEKQLLQDNLGVILGVVKTYMLIGVNGIGYLKPARLMPSPLSIPEPPADVSQKKSGGKVAKQRKCRIQPTANRINKKNDWNDDENVAPPVLSFEFDEGASGMNPFQTSDSELSDNETNPTRIPIMLGKVRQTALLLLFRAVRLTHRNVMFSYWPHFCPATQSSAQHDLLTCILKDSSPKGRMAALNVLLLLLSSSKLYLSQAEKGDNLSFTPFSVALGLSINELHRCLCLALNESSIPTLNMVFKCISGLVQASPYNRLKPGLITKLVRNVREFIYHKDATVQVTSMITLGCILSTEPPIPEIEQCFIKRLPSQNFPVKLDDQLGESCSEYDAGSFASVECSWLVQRCFTNLGVIWNTEKIADNAMAVKLESLKVISAMSNNYFETLLLPVLSLAAQALNHALLNKHHDIRLHAGRTVDFIGHAIKRYLAHGELSPCVSFWLCLISNSLPSLLEDDNKMLKATGCDCLSSITSDVFEQLPKDKQILCITLLFAAANDIEDSVRGAAIRALAVYVLFLSLREDLGFVMDTTYAILTAFESNYVNVQIKASWALGNLSEALLSNKTNPLLAHEFPDTLLLKVVKATNKASTDNEKMKMNTVRGLGSLLPLIPEELIEEEGFRVALETSLHILIDSICTSPNMKVRWNACHALAQILRTDLLFKSTINWQDKMFPALTDLIVKFRNFKVRINAAMALASPSKREYYQDYFYSIFTALVNGLQTSQNMEDFSEYKHRDQLLEQICLSVGHLITLSTERDLRILKESLQSEYLSQQISRIWDKLVPEKASVLCDARTHLGELLEQASNCDSKKIITYLLKIFTQGIE